MTLTQIIEQKPAAQMVLECFGGDLRLSDCTAARMKQLAAYMQKKVAKNSAKTYAAYIKAALNLHRDEVPLNFAQGLKIRGEATISVYLTEPELKALYLAAKTPKERYYMLLFMISATQGCRMSDVQNITEGNISDGWLRYVCRKTGCKAEVPARPELAQWIAEIQKSEVKFCEMTYKRTIRELAEYAGINSMVKIFRGGVSREDEKFNFVSSHTARRSFATNLYLRGCDLYTISRYMGHSSMEMTSRYICSETRDMNDNIKEFFNN